MYGDLKFNLKDEAWVRWAFERYMECNRVCRGLVAWVVEGKTRKFRWSAVPVLLAADLHRAGVKLRKFPIFQRYGISGSGGPDWWRNDYEFILTSAKGKLPWSNNTATGGPCKYRVGGEMSYRHRDGVRKNARHRKNSETAKHYKAPKIANPGNFIQETEEQARSSIVRCTVGGGHMGSKYAHLNEAPFPEALVRPFILSYCPPGGEVLDIFGGSGTTAKVAAQEGRNAIVMELREDQLDIVSRRVREEVPGTKILRRRKS